MYAGACVVGTLLDEIPATNRGAYYIHASFVRAFSTNSGRYRVGSTGGFSTMQERRVFQAQAWA